MPIGAITVAIVALTAIICLCGADICFMGKQPDPRHPELGLRWVLPYTKDSLCQCTKILFGGTNTTPFHGSEEFFYPEDYEDDPLSLVNNDNVEEIKKILRCWPTDSTDCKDEHVDCPYWASDGECDKNPGYMLRSCRLSCNVCEGTPHLDKKCLDGGSCYLVNNNIVTRDDAVELCEIDGGHLADITTREEQEFINDMLDESSVTNAWFGLLKKQEGYFTDYPHGYKWSDGSTLQYETWYYIKSDEDTICMRIRHGFYWFDMVCDTKYKFVCEFEQ